MWSKARADADSVVPFAYHIHMLACMVAVCAKHINFHSSQSCWAGFSPVTSQLERNYIFSGAFFSVKITLRLHAESREVAPQRTIPAERPHQTVA